ncbi:hypothetical protein GUITHDRAFT_113173 [Guillardia theta CCMP2712]|uniref:Bromo domain-containing protein n=1 Tax=Guillardia theta (strain CCMP2712) TaxID=905079 RepID=L1IXM7_GUITC|nr:hypothetical protein GUITHDRAFT_113173 [Guillardia theta CCMP2712]EKX40639.1 hypothetical protein GUITHDRAFT_113173 [Guillardia theta CCMP2712]|eukprot:XP_005827619.1 hypothetical protein GUITHDRAFT_113173 [Guillardia theta CCMP2712]
MEEGSSSLARRELLVKQLMKLKGLDKHRVFHHAVTDEIAPGYSKLILSPICFDDMGRKLEESSYDQEPLLFFSDFLLLLANALIYNEPGSKVASLALSVGGKGIKVLADQVREWNVMLESRASPEGLSQETESLLRQLEELDKLKVFLLPVSLLEVPSYREVISLPMDLQTMRQQAEHGRYQRRELLLLDSLLIGVNCCLFNPPDSVYYQTAIEFLRGAIALLAQRRVAEAVGRGGGNGRRQRREGRRETRSAPSSSEESEESEEEEPRKRKRARRYSEDSEEDMTVHNRGRRSSRKTNGERGGGGGGRGMILRLRNPSSVSYHEDSASEGE